MGREGRHFLHFLSFLFGAQRAATAQTTVVAKGGVATLHHELVLREEDGTDAGRRVDEAHGVQEVHEVQRGPGHRPCGLTRPNSTPDCTSQQPPPKIQTFEMAMQSRM